MLTRTKRYLQESGVDCDFLTRDIINGCDMVQELAYEQLEEPLREKVSLSSSDLRVFDIEASQIIIKSLMGTSNDFDRLETIIGILCDRVGFGGVQDALDQVKRAIIDHQSITSIDEHALGDIDEHPF